MARRSGRVESCDAADARVRLRDAQAQLDLATLADATSSAEARKAAAACAVVSGIAAADAACCAVLGERSRSQDHRDAADLIRRITAGGDQAARHLGRLLGLKDAAQYGLNEVSGPALVAFAEQVVAM